MNSKDLSPSSNSEALIRMAMNGCLEAFNELVSTHQDMVYNLAFALLGDPALAEDAAQESFVKAFKNMSRFRGGSFRSWLLRIVTNESYDVLRQTRRHPAESLFPIDETGEEMESPSWIADPAASVENNIEQRQTSMYLRRILEELPDVYRSVITLIDIHEVDYVEAASILGVPLGTVKSRLARARHQMAAKLKGTVGFERGLAGSCGGSSR